MRIKHLSISQLNDHERNPRYWIYSKVLKLPRTSSKALKFGSEAHDMLEYYIKGSLKREDAPKEYLKYLDSFINHPDFTSLVEKCEVEKSVVTILEGKEYPFIGRVDLYQERYGFLQVPLILDFKFLGTTKYAPSSYELKKDRQLLYYAYHALEEAKFKPKGVRVRHIQFIKSRTGKRKDVADHKETFVCKDRILKAFNSLQEDCTKLERTLRKFKEGGMDEVNNKCEGCQCRFGPASCEYSGICDGLVTKEEYIELYHKAHKVLGRLPYSQEMVNICRNQSLNNKLKSIDQGYSKETYTNLADQISTFNYYQKQSAKSLSWDDANNNKGSNMSDVIISNESEALFINLNSPDNFDGKYAITVKLDPKNKKDKEFIDSLMEATKAGKKELTESGSTSSFRGLTLRSDKDAEGNDTGLVLFRASSKYQPGIFNKSGEKITQENELGRGSKVKLKVVPKNYDFKGNSGVTFYLNAIQVIKEEVYEAVPFSEETF